MYHHRHHIPRPLALAGVALALAAVFVVLTHDLAGAAGLEWQSVAQFEPQDEPPAAQVFGRFVGLLIPPGVIAFFVIRKVRRDRRGRATTAPDARMTGR